MLVAGGQQGEFKSQVPFASSELFDPAHGTWSATGSIPIPMGAHTATLLSGPGCAQVCGRVLVAGGYTSIGTTAAAFLYNPGSGPNAGTWSPTGPIPGRSMAVGRLFHAATLITGPACASSAIVPCGSVLVTGGIDGISSSADTAALLYEPSKDLWTRTAPMNEGRHNHGSALLPDGTVLVVGGSDRASAEVYDPGTGTWRRTGSMHHPRTCRDCTGLDFHFNTTALPGSACANSADVSCGRVLITGGFEVNGGLGTADTVQPTAEFYDPSETGTLAAGPGIVAPVKGAFSQIRRPPAAGKRWDATTTVLPSGKVLFAGGRNTSGGYGIRSALLFDPQATVQLAVVLSVAPTSGPERGGTRVVVNGLGLDRVTAVHFGEVPTRYFRVESPEKLTVSAPAHVVGVVDVAISTADGPSPVTDLDRFTYGTWSGITKMSGARANHSATVLEDGRVMIIGGDSEARGTAGSSRGDVEMYDPSTARWASGRSLHVGRAAHTATALEDGSVLVAGGRTSPKGTLAVSGSEVYNAVLDEWIPDCANSPPTPECTGELRTARFDHTATLVSGGRVLVIGGTASSGNTLATVEAYDPASGTWSELPSGLHVARTAHTATRLLDGRVLVVGGNAAGGAALDSSELYDPVAGTWSEPPSRLHVARTAHTATRLLDGRVLVVGGKATSGAALDSSEIYDPVAGTWSELPNPLRAVRAGHSATLIETECGDICGQVVVAGGFGLHGRPQTSVERFDPARGTWVVAEQLVGARAEHRAVQLPDGRVLVVGGFGPTRQPVSSVELFLPTAANVKPHITAVDPAGGPSAGGTKVTLRGAGFLGVQTTVTFGGAEAATRFVSDGEIDVISPPHIGEGTVQVVVTVDGRSSRQRENSRFVYGRGSWQPAGVIAPSTFADGVTMAGSRQLRSRSANFLQKFDLGSEIAGSNIPPKTTVVQVSDPQTVVMSNDATATGVGITFSLARPRVTHSAIALDSSNCRRLPQPYCRKVMVIGGSLGVGDAAVSTTSLFDPVTGKWEVAAPMSSPRSDFTATLLDGPACRRGDAPGYCGNILVVGGSTGDGALSSAELYDPQSGSWRATAPLMTKRLSHVAALLDGPQCEGPVTPMYCGKVLVAGGADVEGGRSTRALSSTELYDPATGTWFPSGRLVTGRSGFAAAVLTDGRLLVVGGLVPGGPGRNGALLGGAAGEDVQSAGIGIGNVPPGAVTPTAEMYDPETGMWSSCSTAKSSPSCPGPLAVGRFAHSATVLEDGRVLVAGGSVHAGLERAQGCGAVPSSDPSDACFPKIVLAPVADSDPTDAVPPGPTAAVELFDPSTGRWTAGDQMHASRMGHSATVLPDGRVLVAGHGFPFNQILKVPDPVASAELFDPVKGTWSETTPMGVARGVQTATVLGGAECRAPSPPSYCGSVLVAGGMTTSTAATDTAEIYTEGPEVRTLEPPRGPTRGGTTLIVTGTGFSRESLVRFGSAELPPESVVVESPFRLRVVSPPAPTRGPAQVVVSNRSGTSATAGGDQRAMFTYLDAPGPVIGLVATATSAHVIELTIPRVDDGSGVGPADSFVVKEATGPISEAIFDHAISLCDGVCSFPKKAERAVLKIKDLEPNTTYHFAARAVSEGGLGEVSASVSATTLGIKGCSPASQPDGGGVLYPGGRYTLVGLPGGTIAGADSPLYGWFDLGAGGSYAPRPGGDAVEGGRGYWAWFACSRLVRHDEGAMSAALPLGSYHAAMIGNPSGVRALTASGYDFSARWDPALNEDAGGYLISGYREQQSLAVGQGMWAFSYVDTIVRIE
ncbi:MAG TPA: kelch repeat-containing protein [Acidimicrobiales bacterium]|nr:kelch repeat-containing protein [Acidimicrobiales bacterium]